MCFAFLLAFYFVTKTVFTIWREFDLAIPSFPFPEQPILTFNSLSSTNSHAPFHQSSSSSLLLNLTPSSQANTDSSVTDTNREPKSSTTPSSKELSGLSLEPSTRDLPLLLLELLPPLLLNVSVRVLLIDCWEFG